MGAQAAWPRTVPGCAAARNILNVVPGPGCLTGVRIDPQPGVHGSAHARLREIATRTNFCPGVMSFRPRVPAFGLGAPAKKAFELSENCLADPWSDFTSIAPRRDLVAEGAFRIFRHRLGRNPKIVLSPQASFQKRAAAPLTGASPDPCKPAAPACASKLPKTHCLGVHAGRHCCLGL